MHVPLIQYWLKAQVMEKICVCWSHVQRTAGVIPGVGMPTSRTHTFTNFRVQDWPHSLTIPCIALTSVAVAGRKFSGVSSTISNLHLASERNRRGRDTPSPIAQTAGLVHID